MKALLILILLTGCYDKVVTRLPDFCNATVYCKDSAKPGITITRTISVQKSINDDVAEVCSSYVETYKGTSRGSNSCFDEELSRVTFKCEDDVKIVMSKTETCKLPE